MVINLPYPQTGDAIFWAFCKACQYRISWFKRLRVKHWSELDFQPDYQDDDDTDDQDDRNGEVLYAMCCLRRSVWPIVYEDWDILFFTKIRTGLGYSHVYTAIEIIDERVLTEKETNIRNEFVKRFLDILQTIPKGNRSIYR